MSEEDDHKTACLPTRKFAGMEFDSETGNYYDYARFYSPRLGRFISPDPADLTAVDPTNPQSWNRYTYVLNNPTSFTDPLGLCGDNEMEDNGQCLPATPIGTSGTVSGGDTLNQVLFLLENGGSWGDNFGQVVGGGIAPNPVANVPLTSSNTGPSLSPSQAPYSTVMSEDTQRSAFVAANMQDADLLATLGGTTTANILGLSAFESRSGTSDLATNYANYFGLTYPFPGSGSPRNGFSTYTGQDSFFTSGFSLISSQIQGPRIAGTATAAAFVAALTTPPEAFNSERGYGQTLLSVIDSVQTILNCIR